MNKFAVDASAIVAVVTEKMKLAARLGAQFRGVQYSLVDVGIACEHLVLQAAEEGHRQLLAGLVRRARGQAPPRHSPRPQGRFASSASATRPIPPPGPRSAAPSTTFAATPDRRSLRILRPTGRAVRRPQRFEYSPEIL
jgi:hypothetical protein